MERLSLVSTLSSTTSTAPRSPTATGALMLSMTCLMLRTLEERHQFRVIRVDRVSDVLVETQDVPQACLREP